MNTTLLINGNAYEFNAGVSDLDGRKALTIQLADIESAGLENGQLMGATFTLEGQAYVINDGLAPLPGPVSSLTYLAEAT